MSKALLIFARVKCCKIMYLCGVCIKFSWICNKGCENRKISPHENVYPCANLPTTPTINSAIVCLNWFKQFKTNSSIWFVWWGNGYPHDANWSVLLTSWCKITPRSCRVDPMMWKLNTLNVNIASFNLLLA